MIIYCFYPIKYRMNHLYKKQNKAVSIQQIYVYSNYLVFHCYLKHWVW